MNIFIDITFVINIIVRSKTLHLSKLVRKPIDVYFFGVKLRLIVKFKHRQSTMKHW